MATLSEWSAGARPRTLPMAVCPVLIGAAAAFASPAELPLALLLGITALALVVSLALQVGVNYANDYSDGVRGTDDVRVGPMRLTASGAARPGQVKAAAFLSFGIAGIAGLVIVLVTAQWWMLAVGAVCVLAAWWYTGGSKPYGYLGLGEVMVFIFFGLVATLGTTYAVLAAAEAQDGFPWVAASIGAVSHGLIASALLMANNVRDIPTDRESGKMTLAVRLGDTKARWAYVVMVAAAVLLPLWMLMDNPWVVFVALSWALAVPPAQRILNQQHTGPALIPVLQQTGSLGLVFAITYSLALLIGA